MDPGAGDRRQLVVPVTYEVPGATLHCPVVEAVVGGVQTRLIVDTGATEHVLTLELVDRTGLTRKPGISGTDAAGAEVPSWEVDRPPIVLGGMTLPDTTVPAIEGPAPFAAWGVGGFLSPQSLFDDHVVIVDFARNSLEVHAASAALLEARILSQHPGAVAVEGKRHASGMIGIEVTVPPAAKVVAFFDSGAASTAVVMAAAPGGQRMRTRSVGGTEMEAGTLAMATVVAGAATFSLNLSVVSEIAAPDGSARDEAPLAAVGMDLLRETMLVISDRNDGAVSWIVPRGHPALSI